MLLSRSLALSLTIAVAAACSVNSATAQTDRPQRAPGGPGGPGGGAPGGPGGAPQNQGRGGFGGVNFDDKQRELLREAMQKDTEALRALDEKLREAQKELIKAVLADKYEEKVVREKAEAVAKIQVEITLLRGKALATLAPTLKPEQREGMEGPFGIMLLSGGGGRGGFGGGGPGGQQGGQGGQGIGGRGNRGGAPADAGQPGGQGGQGGQGGRRRGGPGGTQ